MITGCSLCVATGDAKVEDVIFIIYGMSVCIKHIQLASEERDYNRAVWVARGRKV